MFCPRLVATDCELGRRAAASCSSSQPAQAWGDESWNYQFKTMSAEFKQQHDRARQVEKDLGCKFKLKSAEAQLLHYKAILFKRQEEMKDLTQRNEVLEKPPLLCTAVVIVGVSPSAADGELMPAKLLPSRVLEPGACCPAPQTSFRSSQCEDQARWTVSAMASITQNHLAFNAPLATCLFGLCWKLG